jgi:hypothetical protein
MTRRIAMSMRAKRSNLMAIRFARRSLVAINRQYQRHILHNPHLEGLRRIFVEFYYTIAVNPVLITIELTETRQSYGFEASIKQVRARWKTCPRRRRGLLIWENNKGDWFAFSTLHIRHRSRPIRRRIAQRGGRVFDRWETVF